MNEPQTITICIHGENLPGARFGERESVRVGIQKGEEAVQDVSADAECADFVAELLVKRNAKDGRPMFSGPFVFGPSKEPFLYLSWGERNGDEWEMFRRLKIVLEDLSWDMIYKAADTGQPIEAVVGLTDEKGGPNCGGKSAARVRWLK